MLRRTRIGQLFDAYFFLVCQIENFGKVPIYYNRIKCVFFRDCLWMSTSFFCFFVYSFSLFSRNIFLCMNQNSTFFFFKFSRIYKNDMHQTEYRLVDFVSSHVTNVSIDLFTNRFWARSHRQQKKATSNNININTSDD